MQRGGSQRAARKTAAIERAKAKAAARPADEITDTSAEAASPAPRDMQERLSRAFTAEDTPARKQPQATETPAAQPSASAEEKSAPVAEDMPAPEARTPEQPAAPQKTAPADEIGTPVAVTIDFESIDDQQVTVRDRDTMSQVRVPIDELVPALRERLGF